MQTPPVQVSPIAQPAPLSQEAPSAFGTIAQVPVVGLQAPALWQGSVGVGQTTAGPGTQVPAWQTSVVVQALLSLQGVLAGATGFEQVPLAGSQAPALWHWSVAGQVLRFAPVHTPPWQLSVGVQASPSLQVVPLGALVPPTQVPVLGLQVPGVWQTSGALQRIGVPMVQMPSVQMSPWVQALPSLQVVPLAAGGFEQAPVAWSVQIPTMWQTSRAVQLFGPPPVQMPDEQ